MTSSFHPGWTAGALGLRTMGNAGRLGDADEGCRRPDDANSMPARRQLKARLPLQGR